ncbi:uncharacterized protein LOC135462123 [Liolophura sinensis]|uniref:uncharacterized protein LOC135462123 n=1 Tax=Liolophura sinensis TaxID=3198878 RepID=UPI003158FFAE
MSRSGSLLALVIATLAALNVTTVTGQGFTNINLIPANNGHLGSEFKLDCGFTYADAVSIVRKVHFYRKRQNDPNFLEIANADTQASPTYRWNDTALQSRSNFTMLNRTSFRITIRSLECGDKAEYRCMYRVGNRDSEYAIFSDAKALEMPGSCTAPGDC